MGHSGAHRLFGSQDAIWPTRLGWCRQALGVDTLSSHSLTLPAQGLLPVREGFPSSSCLLWVTMSLPRFAERKGCRGKKDDYLGSRKVKVKMHWL